jgi:hypothetical protein
VPAFRGATDHPHRGDRLGIAAACLQQGVARHGKLRRASGRMARLDFSDECQDDEDNGAEKCSQADIRMEQKTDREIDRHPRQIEERHRAGS